MKNVESNPINRCIIWAHSENYSTSENTRKIINISLIAIQLVGLILLVASLPGSTQLVAMHEKIILVLALGGSALLLGGSFFWAMLGYHQKHSGVKRGIYALTAIAILTIAIGIIATNGLFSGIGISAARCILCAGCILSMPVIFPYLFSLLKCCQSCLDNLLKQSIITPQSAASSRHFSKSTVALQHSNNRNLDGID